MPDWDYAYKHYGSEDHVTLYYDEHNNILIDEDGFIVFDIYEYITPNELALFKKSKVWMIFRNIELVWPEEPWQDSLNY